MMPRSHKATHYLLPALKVFIVGAAFAYIYYKLSANTAVSWSDFASTLGRNSNATLCILLALALAFLNWSLEIQKWRIAVSQIRPLSFKEAARQCLGALTASLITPGRIGEYGVRPMFFPAAVRKHVVGYTFFCNMAQMVITVFFGLFGVAWLLPKHAIGISGNYIVILFVVIAVCAGLGYLAKDKPLFRKGLTLSKAWKFMRSIPKVIQFKVLGVAVLRYLVFSHLFYLLLLFFGVQTDYFIAMPIIWSMYFLASVFPTMLVLDVVIRGGIAVWLFSLEGVPEFPVLCAVLSIWILSFGLPALIGSYFVATFSFPKT